MALDPNQVVSDDWANKADELPAGLKLPEGVTLGPDYYAHYVVYRDGHADVQIYKRGVGPDVRPWYGVGQARASNDPVDSTVTGFVPGQQTKWEEDSKKDAAAPATRVINGVPHQVVGKDANGQDIWAPVQTAAGPASATTTTTQRQDWRSEGTQTGTDANGAPIYDNSRPVMAEYVNGKRTGVTRAPTGDELKDWNAAQQMSRNPGGKTDAELATPVKEEVNPSDPTRLRKPDGKGGWTDAGPNAAGIQAAANAAKPTTVNTSTTEPFIAQQTPDGIKWIPNQNYVGAKPTTSTQKGPDGLTYVISVDKDGNASAKPVQGLPATPSGALPADAPQPSGRLGEAAADLQAFDQYLNAQVRSVPPKMTTDQADKLRDARRSFWATALSEQQGIVNTQKGVYDSQNSARNATMADLSNRRTNATQIANQASSDFMPLATKLGSAPGGGAALMQAIADSRNNAMNFVTLSGANRMVPEVGMGPALTTVNGMPLPGGTAASPQMGASFNPRGGPNALGFGTPGSVSPTGAQVAAGNAATQAATQAALGPLLAPPPQVAASAVATPSAPQPAASAPSPASAGPSPMTAAQAAAYEQGGINPATGDIDVRTTPPAPVPQMGDPSYQDRAPIFQPAPPAPLPPHEVSMMPPVPPTFLAAAAASRGHVHDPTGVIREMIADPRYDNATLRQVLAEQYPGYNIDALMQGAA